VNSAVALATRSIVCFSASNSAMQMASTAVASRKASRLRLTQLSPPSLVSAWKSTGDLGGQHVEADGGAIAVPKTTWVERKSVPSCSSPPSGGKWPSRSFGPCRFASVCQCARVAAELMHSLECLLGNRLRHILSQ